MTNKSTAGHTPGPWEFQELSGDDSRGMGYIIGSDGREISHHGVSERWRAENLANAALIAAAPATAAQRDRLRAENATLLGALKRIADGQVVTGEFSHAEVIVAYQEIARAALARHAKAEGRS